MIKGYSKCWVLGTLYVSFTITLLIISKSMFRMCYYEHRGQCIGSYLHAWELHDSTEIIQLNILGSEKRIAERSSVE